MDVNTPWHEIVSNSNSSSSSSYIGKCNSFLFFSRISFDWFILVRPKNLDVCTEKNESDQQRNNYNYITAWQLLQIAQNEEKKSFLYFQDAFKR